MNGSAVAIHCNGLSKRFDVIDAGDVWRIMLGMPVEPGTEAFWAVKKITLEVPKGQFLGVLGSNGAGKSTLLRVLGGTYAPSEGNFYINGRIGALFELGAAGNRDLTGRDYAVRYLEITGAQPGKALTEMVEWVHTFSELKERFDDPVFTYSSGMAARLFFSVATAQPHEVYFIDEVLSVGDQHFVGKCWRRISQLLANGGVSGILVTHDWSAVLKLCERACILDHGRLSEIGPSEKIVRSYLGKTLPEKEETCAARFCFAHEVYESGLTASTGVDWRLVVPVEILAVRSIRIVFAIEKLIPGIGWEIILSTMDHGVGEQPGFYTLHIDIPRLPLSPGHYMLTMALVEVNLKDPSQRKIHDHISWLEGNGVPLNVNGANVSGAVNLCIWHEDNDP